MKRIFFLLLLAIPTVAYAIGPFDIKLSGTRLDVLEALLPSAARVVTEDFSLFETAKWDSTTLAGGGTVEAAVDSVGSIYHSGVVILKTKNAAKATTQLRYLGAAVQSLTGKFWEMETKVAINDTTNGIAYIGFVTNADSILGNTEGVQGAYFKKAAGSSFWSCGVMTSADTTTSTSTTNTNYSTRRATPTVFKIVWDRAGYTTFYMNGRKLTTIAKAPDAADLLRPCFEVRANSAAVQTMYIDYVTLKSTR